MFLLLLSGLFLACHHEGDVSLPLGEAPADLVSAYTTGLVGRKANIEVRFTHDVNPAEHLISIEPAVEGEARWESPSVLVFDPNDELTPGKTYTVRVDLPKVASDKAPFGFQFGVVTQGFTPDVAGLAADGDGALQTLSGTIALADEADAADVEALLEAEHGDDKLALSWTHDGNSHGFVVRGIKRVEDASTLTLAFDGKSIGVDHSQDLTINVAGLNQFVVSSARAVTTGDRHIELRFSDPLQPKQDLSGLIRVDGRPDIQIQRDGSVVNLYSANGWSDTETVQIAGVRNMSGFVYKGDATYTVSFAPMVPSVKFATAGVILPSDAKLTLPIDVVNVRAVEIEAMQVYEQNVPQFLQVNALDGKRELQRVGKVVWREHVEIPAGTDAYNRVQHVGLDVSKLVKDNPTGLYRIAVRFKRADILLECTTPAWDEPDAFAPQWDDEVQERSFWDYFTGDGDDSWTTWEHREDPCTKGFYLPTDDHDITASRNFILSDLGLVAKQGLDGQLVLVATDLVKATPVPGADVQVLDYQLQPIAKGVSGPDGTLRLEMGTTRPFAVVAHKDGQASWLRLDKGSTLAMSHFDVGGAEAPKGLQGYLYGERGIWRPGDDIYLTFVLHDTTGRVPEQHPADLELVNPLGQVVDKQTATDAVDGFYGFRTRTMADAPTGNYTARVKVGGATFEKTLRVETVVPNRLKIGMTVPTLVKAESKLDSTLEARWLHGAKAPHFAADIELRLAPQATSFTKYGDYTFDDPMASFGYEPARIWEGELDEEGRAAVDVEIPAPEGAPGMLSGTLRTRVYEPSGAFSVDEAKVTVSPYHHYVGVQLPKGDAARGMLLTDQKQPAKLVLLDEDGKPVKDGKVEVALYKIGWRWWWEKGSENLAQYAESRELKPLQTGTVDVKNGTATWNFEVKFPDWGRYLVVAKDTEGGHRAGRIVYIDWPGWAGRARADQPGGASVLSVTTDVKKAEVGKPVTLSFPMAKGSRALVSLESGSRVVAMNWVEPTEGSDTAQYTFTTTPAMAPGVYANVSVVQPHGTKTNDAPIRLYGVAPIEVFDPGTKLAPKITTASVFTPDATSLVSVAETNGRPMTYTLAVVDEGLLGLTRFATPDPWSTFFQRPALGVRSWDLYDQVVGAYGGALESLLSVGGDGDGAGGAQPKAQRFKPMVHYEGPFTLGANETRKHEVPIPQYVGEVRVMVVGGHDGAYGAAEVSVPVKKPLMVLASLPRVLGPQETVDLPVSVFALDTKVKDVSVAVTVEGPLKVEGDSKQSVRFTEVGDKMRSFRLQVGDEVGIAKVHVVATGGGETAKQDIEIDVRHPGIPIATVLASVVQPGRTWTTELALDGVAGTRSATLELSRVPPIDLGRRLDDLIAYPHGCIEQTTSSVFPQVWLSKLIDLDAARTQKTETNIRAGIQRLRSFQNADGGFGYWPGNTSDAWGTNYAGHFLLEAERAGYLLPAGMRSSWVKFQKEHANRWVKTEGQSDLDQAYRLYTLALAGTPDVGAMNRLKEVNLSTAARWRLGAAWLLAGQRANADAVIAKAGTDVAAYHELTGTFGSDLRDEAMILEAATLLGDLDRAAKVAATVSRGLSNEQWLSTQSAAYGLVAMARFSALGGTSDTIDATWSLDGGPANVKGNKPIVQLPLPVKQTGRPKFDLLNNAAKVLYARVIERGAPPIGKEVAAANGLTLAVEYRLAGGSAVSVESVEHGSDLVAHVTITNTTGRRLDELALSEVFPSGWQIGGISPGRGPGFDYRDVRDDRVYTYFDLEAGGSLELDVPVNASYAGRFYLPPVSVEAMYDAAIRALIPGAWTTVAAMPEG